MIENMRHATRHAFDVAAAEDKHSSRDELVERLAPPLSASPPPKGCIEDFLDQKLLERPAVMRVQMNHTCRETLIAYPNAIYIACRGCETWRLRQCY